MIAWAVRASEDVFWAQGAKTCKLRESPDEETISQLTNEEYEEYEEDNNENHEEARRERRQGLSSPAAATEATEAAQSMECGIEGAECSEEGCVIHPA